MKIVEFKKKEDEVFSPHKGAVQFLEDLLSKYKNGEIQHFAATFSIKDGGGRLFSAPDGQLFSLIGELEALKQVVMFEQVEFVREE